MDGFDLLDSAEPLVVRHDAVSREVVLNERLYAFARYWGFRPRTCAPDQGQGREESRAPTPVCRAAPRRTCV
jgi:hypothetical protein